MATKSKSIKITHTKLEIDVAITPELIVKEELDQLVFTTNQEFGGYTIIKLDVIQAMTLRNKLSAWANAKRYRDQRNDKGDSSLSDVHSST